jgi:DNA repair exonuclease SbcCD ATPase subunit
MRAVAEIEEEIAEISGKIAIVDRKLREKSTELESLRRANANLVEANIGKQRMPRSLETQRRIIFEVNQQIEELGFAKESLEEKLDEAQEELRYAVIYRQIEACRENDEVFFGRMNRTVDAISQVGESVTAFKKEVEQLEKAGLPLHELLPLLKELAGKISLSAFIKEGVLTDPDPDNDNHYLDELYDRFALREQIPEIESLNTVGDAFLGRIDLVSSLRSELRYLRS